MLFVVAAGGTGSRMLPVTRHLNKHLIPTEMGSLVIDYPLRMFAKHHAEEVVVVTGSNHASQIIDYVEDGSRYGFKRIEYAFQSKPAGIADVLKRIIHKKNTGGVLLILGDNYFSNPQLTNIRPNRAMAFQYDIGSIEQAKAFGQIVFENHIPADIVEKPKNPTHSLILTGLYYFPNDVFDLVEKLSPSQRNELEITDLLRLYLKQERLDIHTVDGEWADLGEWPSLQKFWKSRS